MVKIYIETKNNEIIIFSTSIINWFESIEINNEEYNKMLEWYRTFINNWKIIKQEYVEPILEEVKVINLEEKQDLENQKTQIEKELVEMNWLIEWAQKLKDMWVFDDDNDELELVWYETKAQQLIVKRSEIKAQIKLLK